MISKDIEDHKFYMETLFEPFPMIEYSVHTFKIDFMNIGKEEENVDWDIGWIGQFFRNNSNNMIKSGAKYSSDEGSNRRSGSGEKPKKWKWSLL